MRADTLLRAARAGAGISQRELAQRTGIPQSTIARVERGQTDPRASTLAKLLLGCGRVLGAAGPAGSSMGLSQRASRYLPEIVDRLAVRFSPSRIILFGSQARGRATESSDLDLLVVMPHVDDKRAIRVAMRTALADLPIDKDIVVVTADEAAARPSSIAGAALRDGVVLYGA